jgi:hypothetical protein
MSLFGLNMSKTFLSAACRAFMLLNLAREQKSLTPLLYLYPSVMGMGLYLKI